MKKNWILIISVGWTLHTLVRLIVCRYHISHSGTPQSNQQHSAEEGNKGRREIRAEQDGGTNSEVGTEEPDIDKSSQELIGGHAGVTGSYLSNLSLDHLLLLLANRVESEVMCAGPCQASTMI